MSSSSKSCGTNVFNTTVEFDKSFIIDCVFDISGKKIFSHLNLGSNSSYAFSTAALSDGVYLAKIQSSDGKNKVQKIIVSSN